jgi:hypothetical protein
MIRVTCPVVASSAAYIFFFDPELAVKRIMRKLGHLPGEEKEVWALNTLCEGGL